jgi:TonB family protein
MSDLKDDIEKYLKGELSPKQMHELEKKSLSDPFLADALEGGSSIGHHEFSKDVEDLNKKIYKKETTFTPLRIAAGLVILIGAGLFFVLNNEKKEEIAEVSKQEIPADSIKTKRSEPILLVEEKPVIKKKKTSSSQPMQTEVQNAPVVTSLLEEHDTTMVINVERAPVAVAKNTHLISGTVTTKEDDLPLPGVTVLIKGTTRGTTTDIDGNYSLEVADTSSLLFSFVGMQTNEVTAGQKSSIDVKMNEDVSQLSEIVIARTALPSDNDSEFEGPVVRLAQPVGGVRAYNKYLESNRQYPQQALDNDVKGRVIVGFDVGSDGTLNNFKVIRSLGFGCDEEVLRLVREGASWHPTTEDNKPVESTVHVKMKFDAVKYKKRKK